MRASFVFVACATLFVASPFAIARWEERAASPASISPVTSESRVRAEGRLVASPGAEASLAFEVPGTLALLLREKTSVKKGEVVASLASDEQRAQLAEARARLAEAEADERLFGLELARVTKLRR